MANDGDNKKKVARWLRPMVFPFEDGEPKAAWIAVKHVGASGKLTEVRTLKIADNNDEAKFAALIVDIEQTMLDDVEGTGGMQRYVAQSLDDAKKPISRLTLRYIATRTEEETEGGFDSEPATIQGMLAQQMRHNEALERIDKAGWGQIIKTQADQIANLTEANNTLTERHLEMLALMEELQSGKHEREMEQLRENNAAAIKQRIGGQVAALLPAIAKKITGADIGGVVDPDVMSMRQVLQSLNEEQLVAMQGILTPEQTLSILSLVKGEGERPDN